MNALRSFVSRSGLSALPKPVRRSPPRGQRPGARRFHRACLFGLVLVATGVPAYGFDRKEPAPQTAENLVLDTSGVPASANWVVLDATGTAAWRAQGETRWHRFTRGEVLPPGSEIETGPDGEIMLVAGGDQLTIAPHGRLIVPFARPGQDRRLRHERGRILVQIESRKARDVRVDTPLLSLGIKGTTFEVVVDPEQDSVVVHDGEVEVTTPGQPDPVDLGAGDGLRQSAVPGVNAARFTLPGPDAPAGSPGEPGWHLPPAGTNPPAEPETLAPATPTDSAAARARSDNAHTRRHGAESPETEYGWVDELASSWAYVAIAGVSLLILAIPGLALLQNLREQWRSRPRAKGRRRRELVRG